MDHEADLLILDADGVVFSGELERFVWSRGATTGEDPDSTIHRWRQSVREGFLSGRIPPAEMWATMFPGQNPAELTADLERRYRPGPLFDVAARGDRRTWLLANDRSGWLLPRLRRFGLLGCFERIVVSDQTGRVTPDAAAFEPVLDAMRFDSVVLVDDDPMIVEAASRLGIDARLPLDPTPLGGDSAVAAAA